MTEKSHMNKSNLIAYIAEKHNCTKVDAERVIDMFTSSVIGALSEGKEIALIGFGNFSVVEVPARSGRNPRTGEKMHIEAYNQPKFRIGRRLKHACNKHKKFATGNKTENKK